MHGPLDDPQLGWHGWGLPLETHWRGVWNLPHSGGGNCPPGSGTWAITPGNLCTTRALRVDWCSACQMHSVNWCSEYLSSSLPITPTQLPPSPEGKETPERDWGCPKPHRQMGPLLPAEERKRAQRLEGLPRSPRLLSGVAWRNGCAGHDPPGVGCSFWNAPRVLCRAVQEFCRCHTPYLRGEIY